MAFDISSAADLAALKAEVETDPLAIGYAATNGSTNALLNLLNDAANNTGGETTGSPITARVLWEIAANNPDDLTPHGQFSAGDQFVMQMLFEISLGPDDDLSWARQKIIDLFPVNDGVRTDIEALLRGQSRAEVLFGVGTSITRNDWIAARES